MEKNHYTKPEMMNSSSTLRTNLLAGSGSLTNGARTRADVDHIGAFNFKVDIGGITTKATEDNNDVSALSF
ncbi:MAG: hypothetical protein J5663_06505 [Bacteroidaceae bacterium]|nr:hypothetical protein [Bacteroidaceae bacterium]